MLVVGESGTGKELVARSLHDNSSRRSQPFLPVNCAAIPETLIESELFGHEKGAFTGATQQRKGLFQDAHGGTLFIDEIGELPTGLQSKLLRAIENKRIMPVGSTREVPVDVRLVVALKEQIELSDIPDFVRYTKQGARRTVFEPGMTIEEMEIEAIRRTLEATGGHRKQTAKRPGLSVRTLQRKIKPYALAPDDSSEDWSDG